MRTAHAEGGAASLWVVAGCALVLVAASTVQIRTTAVLARHRAEAAADLAALAAGTSIGTTAEPCAAAARIAEINGARLTSCALRLDPSGRAGTVRVLQPSTPLS